MRKLPVLLGGWLVLLGVPPGAVADDATQGAAEGTTQGKTEGTTQAAAKDAPPASEGEGDEEPGEDEAAAEAATKVGCLDDLSAEGGRRKGVQKRDFLKRMKIEISALGGVYASDLLSSTYTAGGAVAFFPSEDFGVELLVSYAPVEFRLEAPFTSFEQTRRFVPGSALQALAGLLFSPFHAKFKLTEETILHGDLFAVAGAGRTFHDSVQGITFQAGVGLQLYLWRRVAFRFDVRDFILPQEVLGRGRTTHNLTVLGGLGLWLL